MEAETLVNLPPELERVIFELAAWQEPGIIKSLILVAKRVRVWIEPELYRVVLCYGHDGGQRLLQMMESKPSEFLQKHVHHLALSASVERSDVTRILSTCTKVHDLALWTGKTDTELLSDLRNLTNLRHLSVNLFELFGGDRNFQLPRLDELPFAHLTHLDVFSAMPMTLWPFFSMLPRLTHLSLSDTYIPRLIQTALDTCTVLQLLVVVWNESPGDAVPFTSTISDPRFCVVWCEAYEEDWEEGAHGGSDFWHRAEIARQKRRERRRKGSESEEMEVYAPDLS
ncbi:hypothetical protein MSAN_00428200 [Mycena sanguinolenta]|uniref:Uncharacterized protein n=1 Tax=Mycena sanguinolenta TaxID=230812 RepID=A0A8H6ZEI7_9AGAR|nr:hypothetical protein MSAN_00428200 [Mycena sanguinolenta]